MCLEKSELIITMYVDIGYIYLHSKSHVSNLEQREHIGRFVLKVLLRY